MKILHLMLSNFYIDNAYYQENILPKVNHEQGHEVLIIASTDVFVKNNTLGLTEPGSYVNEHGIPVIRIPYFKVVHNFFSMKVRAYKGLLREVEKFQPDVILFHGAVAFALKQIVKYKTQNPNIKLFVDSHEDFNNSARNFVSRVLLYKLFYKPILLSCLKHIEKILYISKETEFFLRTCYDIPAQKLHFFPLGGELPDPDYREEVRVRIRLSLGLEDDDILCLHSGKIDALKRTQEILEGFSAVESKKTRLVILGSIEPEFEPILQEYLRNDNRIQYLGWRSASELQQYLMACDLYLQLGSQSVTAQNAVCNGAVVAVFPHESYTFLFNDSVYYINSVNEITSLINSILANRDDFKKKIALSREVAERMLDYKEISKIILQ